MQVKINSNNIFVLVHTTANDAELTPFYVFIFMAVVGPNRPGEKNARRYLI